MSVDDRAARRRARCNLAVPQAIRREDDGRLTRERRMRSWVHRVLKEDLGEKVTEAEWTLLWLAAETEDRARRHEPKATARKDGHEVADAPGEDTRRATAWAWSSIGRHGSSHRLFRAPRLSAPWPLSRLICRLPVSGRRLFTHCAPFGLPPSRGLRHGKEDASWQPSR